MSELNKEALKILRRINKAGSSTYDGITANAPTNIIDLNKPMQEREFFDKEAEFFGDSIELSSRLASIDNEYYGVRDDVASALLDYIEERDFDCLIDLQMELAEKKRSIDDKTKEIAEVDLDEFVSEIDYVRAIGHRKEEIKAFERKIKYIELLIHTMQEFAAEKKHKAKEFKEENPDWYSHGFANNTNSPDAGSHMR